MNKIFILSIALLIIGSFIFHKNSPIIRNTVLLNSALQTNIPTLKSPKYFPPIPNYEPRLTKRLFGTFVTPADKKSILCGAAFSGYHTGDDFETLPGEENIDVPIYSLADGKIIFVNWVKGYGGLIVTQNKINAQDVTILYGHVDLNSVINKVGDSVAAGEKLANLGASCSHATDDERKHLHFAIHKSSSIDYRGYVLSESQLSNWLDPLSLLLSIKK